MGVLVMETSDRSAVQGFAAAPESEPPAPVRSEASVANFRADGEVPAGLFPDEHVAEVGKYQVVRADVKCPQCGGCLFLHPACVRPRNTVSCFRCSWMALDVVWWEESRLSGFEDAGE